MIDHPPALIAAFVAFLVVILIAAFAALLVSIFFALPRLGRDDYDEDEDDDGGGGGGWWDKPGRPSGGGPDRVDVEFNAIANAVGKTIKFERKEKEKVLVGY